MKKEQVYKEKADFVADELTAMLRAATRGFVERCEYEHCSSGAEVVHVFTSTQPFGVNVTCDSLYAIAKDVMRALADRY